ncbi:MAG: hypothetical protein ACREBF_01310 [Candidatus Micrarchaeales archaeon]
MEYTSKHIDIMPKDIEMINGIYSILSKPDAMKIFLNAREGFVSRGDTHKEWGLTKKQYYTRLNQLSKGYKLVEKQVGVHKHTALGTVIYNNQILPLITTMRKGREFEMIEVLKKDSRFGAEVEKFIDDLSKVGNS